MPSLTRIIVAASQIQKHRGTLSGGGLWAPCAIGRGGVGRRKREGDGATPIGRFALVAVLYRPDCQRRPKTALPTAPLRRDSGWCDDPADRRYNRPVRLPYPGHHERMWREDRLYDLLIVLDYNLRRPRTGAGSAIFLHLASPAFAATAGCVAVRETIMRRILARSGPGTVIDIR
ncbi:MAG: L,D-transpeptidase family protein [Hyphomicrobiales bacterium]|nr:L,D-transpeptidase family protein [Hyphomicrobiales bacterium]